MKYATLLLLVVSVGCSTMHVNTKIFDQSYADKGDFFELKVRKYDEVRQTRLADGRFEAARQKLLDEQKKLVDTLQQNTGLTPELATITDSDASSMRAKLRSSIDTAFDDARVNYETAHTQVGEASSSCLTAAERDQKVTAAWGALRYADDRLSKLRAALAVTAEKLHVQLTTAVVTAADRPKVARAAAAVDAIKTDSDAAVDSIVGGHGIQEDPMASLMVNAPAKAWRGVINKSDAGGTIGDTDIAIKMESVGEFTIKGVRDDTSKMTVATFQGLNQAVRLAAAAYGIPLPIGNGSTPATPVTLAAPAPFDPEAAESDRLNSRVAALEMLHAIVDQSAGLQASTNDAAADTAARKAAVANLQSAFAAAKDQITIK